MDQTKTKKIVLIVAAILVVIAGIAYFSQSGSKLGNKAGVIYPDTTLTTINWAIDPFNQNTYTTTSAKKIKGYAAPLRQSETGEVSKEVEVVMDSGYLVPRIGFQDSFGRQSLDSVPKSRRALVWVPVAYQSVLQDYNRDWIPQLHHYIGHTPTIPFVDTGKSFFPDTTKKRVDSTKKDTSKLHK